MVNAQEWLESQEEYNTKEKRAQVKKLNISGFDWNNWKENPNWNKLEGELDLSDFINLETLNCSFNQLTNLNLSSCQKLKVFDCGFNKLTNLDLSNLTQLESIECYDNYLTSFDYSSLNPNKLTHLNITGNKLPEQDLTVFTRFINLETLWIGASDEDIQQGFGNNHFFGSLEPLKNLVKLKSLEISNTDINDGVEYLPKSSKEIEYSTKARPDCKLTEIVPQLDAWAWKDLHADFAPKSQKEWKDLGFNKEQTKEWIAVGVEPKDYQLITYLREIKKVDPEWVLVNQTEFKKYKSLGVCKECQQLNTGDEWCQPCMAQHFEAEFTNWTSGNLAVDQIIQDCQLRATNLSESLAWIPYEQFTYIKYLASGGFGKVYQAILSGLIVGWNAEIKEWVRGERRNVVLKSLHNSQNITSDFLQEIVCTKLFSIDTAGEDDVDLIVPCWGISQDPETKNYVMVMMYIEGGNLRNYLQSKGQELTLENKFIQLFTISLGLNSIHRKGLIHQDFHSGNILTDNGLCAISDLGLSRPANSSQVAGQIYGVMPYVAPEVLSGQPYTQASDIYSLGMVMYETLTCLPPYYEHTYDINLALKICQGNRPQFPEQIKYPQLLKDLITRCWEADPLKRPTAKEIMKTVLDWFDLNNDSIKENTQFARQIKAADAYNQTLPEEIRFPRYEIHPGVVYHSKPINTKRITQLLQQKNNEQFGGSKNLELDLNNFNLDELNLQEESSLQAQIEIPPKGNN